MKGGRQGTTGLQRGHRKATKEKEGGESFHEAEEEEK